MKHFRQNETWLHELYHYFLFFLSEFLDSKDPSLAFAVYGASQLNIFPIAVLDVTTADSNKEELLLCFNGKLSDCTWKLGYTLQHFARGYWWRRILCLEILRSHQWKKKRRRKRRRHRLSSLICAFVLPIILIFTSLKMDLKTWHCWKFRSLNFRVWRVCKQLWLSQQEKAFDVEQTATCLWWVPAISPFSKQNFV